MTEDDKKVHPATLGSLEKDVWLRAVTYFLGLDATFEAAFGYADVAVASLRSRYGEEPGRRDADTEYEFGRTEERDDVLAEIDESENPERRFVQRALAELAHRIHGPDAPHIYELLPRSKRDGT